MPASRKTAARFFFAGKVVKTPLLQFRALRYALAYALVGKRLRRPSPSLGMTEGRVYTVRTWGWKSQMATNVRAQSVPASKNIAGRPMTAAMAPSTSEPPGTTPMAIIV